MQQERRLGLHRRHLLIVRRFAWWPLLLAGACGPQTGLLFDVEGPNGQSSIAAGIAALEVRLAHATYCDRFVEDVDARVTVDVHARELATSPFELLVRPPHVVDLSDPILALALARDANGKLVGAAAFDPRPFALHEYREYSSRVALLAAPAAYVTDDGCACVPGSAWIGSGSGQGCDARVVPSFDAFATMSGCTLAPQSPESLGPVCDGQRYPLTYYSEPSPRSLPCFASANGGCAIGSRTCRDDGGVAYAEQCTPDGNAPVMQSSKLCDAYQHCDRCGDLWSCFRGAIGPAIEYRCAVHLDPLKSSPSPCADGAWRSAPLGQAGGGCQAAMLDGVDQPPYTIGFSSGSGDAASVAACPASIVIKDLSPDPNDDLSQPHELWFTVGDQLGHAVLTVVRDCSLGVSLECAAP